jgi:hypothetical protein
VLAHQLGHLEHGDRFLAAKHCLQCVVGIDVGSFLFVLQAVLLDVDPQFFG